MAEQPINLALFQKGFQKIDFNTLELKPQTNLKFCSCPPPSKKTIPVIDVRYLENDSRYITPEDRERYMKEYEDNKIKREIEHQNCLRMQRYENTLSMVQDFEEPEENNFYDEEKEEVYTDEDDEKDEYEFRSSKN
jgi:hypothetical protein